MTIAENFKAIRDDIDACAERAGRQGGEVTLVAVSKTFPAEDIRTALASGITLFGENKLQEAKRKIDELGHTDAVFHLIGHLQSNKARDAVRLFDLIHSIDKLTTAEKVSAEAEKAGKRQKVLIEVHTSGEASKDGVAPQEAESLCRAVSGLSGIELKGLMTIAPFIDDEVLIRSSFRSLRILKETIENKLGILLPVLSMGMSGDYRIAVEEGATMVRVGTAIFGRRDYSK